MNQLPDPMAWLQQRIPLTLLIDLLPESGPRSEEILLEEPADLGWTKTLSAA